MVALFLLIRYVCAIVRYSENLGSTILQMDGLKTIRDGISKKIDAIVQSHEDTRVTVRVTMVALQDIKERIQGKNDEVRPVLHISDLD